MHIHLVDSSEFQTTISGNEPGNVQSKLLELSDTLSKYMVGGPQSKLGIYGKAAVATDAEPCADIARY